MVALPGSLLSTIWLRKVVNFVVTSAATGKQLPLQLSL